MSQIQAFNSVWDALADTPQEAANLRVRADVMRQLSDIIKEQQWTQADAAQHCGTTQPRINDLMRGRIAKFSLDALVNLAAALDMQLDVKLQRHTA